MYIWRLAFTFGVKSEQYNQQPNFTQLYLLLNIHDTHVFRLDAEAAHQIMAVWSEEP